MVFDPKQLLKFIQKMGITRLLITPSLMRSILESSELDHRAATKHMQMWMMEGEVASVNELLCYQIQCTMVVIVDTTIFFYRFEVQGFYAPVPLFTDSVGGIRFCQWLL